MRASPAFQVSLRRFGVWHSAVSAVALLAAATTIAWAWLHARMGGAGWLAGAGLASLVILGFGLSLGLVRAARLRWDGEQWLAGAADTPEDELRPGQLDVSIDLGFWMLLRFTAAEPGRHRRVIWLPAQRRGLESEWHGLRCAVYAPRPAASAAAAARGL